MQSLERWRLIKSLPRTDLYPVLPDMVDDDDEIICKVKMLSLITAQEDQDRREKLNRELNLVGRPSDPSLRSSTLQESSSLPELVGNVGTTNISRMADGSGSRAAANYSQFARPRPHPGRSSQVGETGVSTSRTSGAVAGAASGIVVPPPLPTRPPNARSRLQTEPVRIPSPQWAVQRNQAEIPPRPRNASANRSQSLSPPFSRAVLTSYSVLDNVPAGSAAPDTSHDAPLICLSPQATKFSRVDDFDLNSLDPFLPLSSGPPTNLRNSPVAATFSDPVPQNLPRPSSDQKFLPYRSSPLPYPVDASYLPSSPFVGGSDMFGGYPVIGFMPWVTNDLCSPSGTGFPIAWATESSGNVATSSATLAETNGRNVPAGSAAVGASGGSDLMDFSADPGIPQLDPICMNLADFDPLFSVDAKAWNCEQRFDSDELFLRPGNQPPPPSAAPQRTLASLPDVVAESSSLARLASIDELQDPFSVEDLMVSLEKKRQKHAREQEAQDLNASPRITAANASSPSNATPSKRKVNLHHSAKLP